LHGLLQKIWIHSGSYTMVVEAIETFSLSIW
jgi:hypothetical protein